MNQKRGEIGENPNSNYILFEVHFMGRYVTYYPEMFINICYNFLIADMELKRDIELLI